MDNVVVIDHPLVAHKLSLLRDKRTPTAQFRHLVREVSLLLGYEVLRDLQTELRDIETPVGPARVPLLKGKKLVFVPILRAGNGLLDGLLDLVPSARVGHVGLVPQDGPARRHDAGAVPVDDGLERGRVAGGGEPGEEVGVRRGVDGPDLRDRAVGEEHLAALGGAVDGIPGRPGEQERAHAATPSPARRW